MAMYVLCASSAFLCQGSNRLFGHWSMQPHRATRRGFLILNHVISEPSTLSLCRPSADDISRQFGPSSGLTKC